MIAALAEALGEALPGLLRGLLRSVAFVARIVVTIEGAFDMLRPADFAAQRRIRRRIKACKVAGDADGLRSIYHGLAPTPGDRKLRLDAMKALVDLDPRAAVPVLRDALDHPTDKWATSIALEYARKHRLVDLVASTGALAGEKGQIPRFAAEVTKKLESERQPV